LGGLPRHRAHGPATGPIDPQFAPAKPPVRNGQSVLALASLRCACRRDVGRWRVKALKMTKHNREVLEAVVGELPPEITKCGLRVRKTGDEDTRLGNIRTHRKAMTFITSTWAFLCSKSVTEVDFSWSLLVVFRVWLEGI